MLGQPVSGLRVSVLDAEGLRSLGDLFPSTAHRGLCLAGVSGRSDRNAVVPECELTRGTHQGAVPLRREFHILLAVAHRASGTGDLHLGGDCLLLRGRHGKLGVGTTQRVQSLLGRRILRELILKLPQPTHRLFCLRCTIGGVLVVLLRRAILGAGLRPGKVASRESLLLGGAGVLRFQLLLFLLSLGRLCCELIAPLLFLLERGSFARHRFDLLLPRAMAVLRHLERLVRAADLAFETPELFLCGLSGLQLFLEFLHSPLRLRQLRRSLAFLLLQFGDRPDLPLRSVIDVCGFCQGLFCGLALVLGHLQLAIPLHRPLGSEIAIVFLLDGREQLRGRGVHLVTGISIRALLTLCRQDGAERLDSASGECLQARALLHRQRIQQGAIHRLVEDLRKTLLSLPVHQVFHGGCRDIERGRVPAGAEALRDPQPVRPNAHLSCDRGLAIAAHRLERHDLLLAGLGVHARVEQELHGLK